MTPPGAGDGPDGGEARWAGPGPGDGDGAVTGAGVAARGRSAAGTCGTGGAAPGAARGGGGPEDRELLGRVFLARVFEPGDEAGGRWVRERGAPEVVRRLREGGGRCRGEREAVGRAVRSGGPRRPRA